MPLQLPENRRTIVGIGSALIDILTHEEEDFLPKCGALKGGMALVTYEEIEKTLFLISGEPAIVPGGSACNTVIGVGKLGGSARFVGKCGQDDFGDLFESGLARNEVEAVLFKSATPTGRVISIITPDAQRSMITYLGASAETLPEEISDACFINAGIVHVEGYLLFNPELILSALRCAKRAGALVSLDLASYTVVASAKELLEELIEKYVDILIANEDEAFAFTGYAEEMKAAAALKEKVRIAVLKVGSRGSWICHDRGMTRIEPVPLDRVADTTGAGDLWASGFLYGIVNGFSLDRCGFLGSLCGSEVCRVVGASIPEEGWDRIKEAWRING